MTSLFFRSLAAMTLAFSFFSTASAQGSNAQRYSCKAEFSIERLEFSEPKMEANNEYSMNVLDITMLYTTSVDVSGVVQSDSFQVQLNKVDMLHLDGKRGVLVGQKMGDKDWQVTYFPEGGGYNGSQSLEMICDPIEPMK